MRCCPTSNVLVLAVLFTAMAGCSRTPCYKGYVPVTKEEALAFGRELMDRYEHGDDSWYIQPREFWGSSKVLDANEAVQYFYGLDILKIEDKPLPQTEDPQRARDFMEKAEAARMNILRRYKNPIFKGVAPTYNTYSVYFDFSFDETTQERYLTLVKNKKTGEIVIAGDGMNLPKPAKRK